MQKVKIQIKNRWTGSIIFEYEKENNTLAKTISEYINQAAEKNTRANLTRADLTDANLTDANLTRADLTDANLTDANLTRADLTRANLTDANLTRADLTRANLTRADLTRANLTRADLTRANLTRADLTRADLTRANLTDADLTRANLTDANLTDADLTRANLTRADLTSIKNDMFIVLLYAIPEIKFLKQNIIDGKIDGSTYQGECACLSGTLMNGAKKSNGDLEKSLTKNIMSVRDSSRPIERFFLAIKKGDTPETSQFAKLAFEWIEEFENLINLK